METFLQVFGPVLAIAVGIMLLAVFFKILGRFGKSKDEPPLIKLKGFFKNAEFVDVHLAGSKVLERVKVIGISDASQMGKGGFPHELNGMIVLENTHKKRIMIKAKLINMIVESDKEESKPGKAANPSKADG